VALSCKQSLTLQTVVCPPSYPDPIQPHRQRARGVRPLRCGSVSRSLVPIHRHHYIVFLLSMISLMTRQTTVTWNSTPCLLFEAYIPQRSADIFILFYSVLRLYPTFSSPFRNAIDHGGERPINVFTQDPLSIRPCSPFIVSPGCLLPLRRAILISAPKNGLPLTRSFRHHAGLCALNISFTSLPTCTRFSSSRLHLFQTLSEHGLVICWLALVSHSFARFTSPSPRGDASRSVCDQVIKSRWIVYRCA
jgi:hypothetical protein